MPAPRETKSVDDLIYSELKALGAGTIPFPTGGTFGASALYTSEDAWSRVMSSPFDGGQEIAEFGSKLGDLTYNSLVMAAVRFLGNTLPEAPLIVKKTTGKKGESDVIPDHPLTKLWARPNQYYSASTLAKAIAFSWITAGNVYIIKFKNASKTKPMELWWEPHWTCRPAWDLEGKDFISHYEVNRNGTWYRIEKENMIHLRDGIDPLNPRCGLSAMGSIVRELYGDQEAANYYARLMGGSGVPQFVVSLDVKDGQITPDEVNAFQRQLVSKTSGPRKGEPIVVRGGRVYRLGFNPSTELDLRGTRGMAEDRFCAVTGISAVVMELGSGAEHSIYNNVKQAMERAYRSYVIPFLNHLEEELDVQLLRDFDGEDTTNFCAHDLEKVTALQEDTDAKATRLSELYTSGIIMRSEARSGLNYGPSDDSDEDADKVFKSQATQPPQPEAPIGREKEIEGGGKYPIGKFGTFEEEEPAEGQKALPGKFEEEKHRRAPKGTDTGGQFAKKDAAAVAADAPPERDDQARFKQIDAEINKPEVLKDLKLPETMYHVTSRQNAEKIVKEGLVLNSKRTTSTGSINGVYLGYSADEILKTQSDFNIRPEDIVVLEVKTSGLNLRLDPEYFDGMAADIESAKQYVANINDETADYAVYSPVSIPAGSIKVSERKRRGIMKSLPNGLAGIKDQDVTEAIQFLKRARYNSLAEMMTADTISTNGNGTGD